MKILIESIPHKWQRYETVGDWQWTGPEDLSIRVSKMQSDYELLVAVHELVEAWLCKKNGVTSEQVDAFDMNYKGTHIEPGDDPSAPYHKEHKDATVVEMILCRLMGIDWLDYEHGLEIL